MSKGICNGCGGILGRDCFNPIECEQITASMNQDNYNQEMDQALDLANLKLEHSKINNKILCRIAIARGNESKRLREEVKRLRAEREILEKERDDSFDKGYQSGINEIDRFRYTLDGNLAEIIKNKAGGISKILIIGDRHPMAEPLEGYKHEFNFSMYPSSIDIKDLTLQPGKVWNFEAPDLNPSADDLKFVDTHPDKQRNGTEQKKFRSFNNRKKTKFRRRK